MADYYVTLTGNDTTGDGSSGNPWATPGKGTGAMAGGDRLNIKAGTYTNASNTVNVATGRMQPPAGAAGAPTIISGYTTTPGDLDNVTNTSALPIIAAQASVSTGSPLNSTGNFVQFYNLLINGASVATTAAFTSGSNNILSNCAATNGTTNGFLFQGTVLGIRLVGYSNLRGINLGSGGAGILIYCAATLNTGAGFYLDSTRCTVLNCIVYGNTGATTDGFFQTGGLGTWLHHCISYNNGRDGIRCSGAGDGNLGTLRNNILVSNAGYGITSVTTNYGNANSNLDCDYNAYYNNTSGARNQVPTGTHDVTLTGVPFTNAGTADFSLNTTASQGAACRAAGYPGTMPTTSVGYIDIGALQHQDPASGGGLLINPGLSGGMR